MDQQVIAGDCVEVMSRMEPESFTGILTDPPYELSFMGKKWDGSGVSFQPETWEEALRVLKPGGMLLAFGGTRTFHRLTCAIEDAGFEIRDCLSWLYGSGFPKSMDVSKALDKAAGATREGYDEPATDEAKTWTGYGTALKPAWEPCILAMKPLDGTFAANALEHGVAGLNVDGGRIGTSGGTSRSGPSDRTTATGWNTGHAIEEIGAGRFPANLLLDEEAAAMLDEQSGESVSSVKSVSAGASRFFYTAKASKKDRGEGNTHPTVKPTKLLEYLLTLLKMPGGGTSILDPFVGSGSTLVAAARVGVKCVGIEREPEYVEICNRRLRQES